MGIWNSSENKAYFRMYSFSPTVYVIIVVIILECKLQLHFYSRDNRPNSTLSSVHNEILWNVFLFHPTRAALHELQCTARHTSNVTIAVFDHSKYVYIKLNIIKDHVASPLYEKPLLLHIYTTTNYHQQSRTFFNASPHNSILRSIFILWVRHL